MVVVKLHPAQEGGHLGESDRRPGAAGVTERRRVEHITAPDGEGLVGPAHERVMDALGAARAVAAAGDQSVRRQRPLDALRVEVATPDDGARWRDVDGLRSRLHHREHGADLDAGPGQHVRHLCGCVTDAPEKRAAASLTFALLAFDDSVEALTSLSLHARPADVFLAMGRFGLRPDRRTRCGLHHQGHRLFLIAVLSHPGTRGSTTVMPSGKLVVEGAVDHLVDEPSGGLPGFPVRLTIDSPRRVSNVMFPLCSMLTGELAQEGSCPTP